MRYRYVVDHDGPYSPTWYETTGLPPTLREIITTRMGKMVVLEIIESAGRDGELGRLRAEFWAIRKN